MAIKIGEKAIGTLILVGKTKTYEVEDYIPAGRTKGTSGKEWYWDTNPSSKSRYVYHTDNGTFRTMSTKTYVAAAKKAAEL